MKGGEITVTQERDGDTRTKTAVMIIERRAGRHFEKEMTAVITVWGEEPK